MVATTGCETKGRLKAAYWMEARVGIGRFTSVFRGKNTKFHQQMQATLALPGRTIAYPLTEGFTETFTEGFQSRRFDPLTIP
jgi:hypothetical protein